ncbi:hypothetical protein ABD72_05675 [Brevibacillus laterosporus]|nr:hypothetical protein [Brevibacillus laterosporus]MBG9801674.1 hypothetical protein [Brevibacillus laterosporus]MBM7111780.1 Tn3 transposase DDE domain protein [Brevibacillus laterosporus]
MGNLGSYSRQNKAATALGEMGRIEKTIFVLDSISNEALRRCIQRGLNKTHQRMLLQRKDCISSFGLLFLMPQASGT